MVMICGMVTKGIIMIDEKELLKQFGYNDYPITYQDGSHGRGMGYGDFEKLIKKMLKEEKKKKVNK